MNNKPYVGKRVASKEAFLSSEYYGSGLIITAAVKKYGKDKFIREVIEECSTLEQLNEREKFWIREINSKEPVGYNIAEGGQGGGLVGRKRPDMVGNKFRVGISSKGSLGQLGSDSHHWKGGRVTSGKYVRIYSPNHPFKDKYNYVTEHRLVVEKILGRYLKDNEYILHKNGNLHDNSPGNLLLKQHRIPEFVGSL